MIMKTKNSKKWTRMFAVAMTLVLALGGTVVAYAAINNDVPGVNLPAESNVPVANNVSGANNDVPGKTEDTDITPYDAVYINDDEYQGTSYDKDFSTNPANGNTLNVYVKNYSSFSVIMKVTNIDTGVSNTYTLAANGGYKTDTWTNPDGIRNSYRVQVDNTDGARMDILVRARQY